VSRNEFTIKITRKQTLEVQVKEEGFHLTYEFWLVVSLCAGHWDALAEKDNADPRTSRQV